MTVWQDCRECRWLSYRVHHDVEILRAGSYAWRLKQRILSDLGHLSNEDGAEAMIRTLGNRTKKIYLGHLSKENNIKELAHMTWSISWRKLIWELE